MLPACDCFYKPSLIRPFPPPFHFPFYPLAIPLPGCTQPKPHHTVAVALEQQAHPSTPLRLVIHPQAAASDSLADTMPSATRSREAVVVEVTPSPIAPQSPPPSPKAVRFASSKSHGISRQLTSTEAWSLYYFEQHARQCPKCYDPLNVYRTGHRLCDFGRDLAEDVAAHVYHKADGQVYSTEKDNHKLVRVEMPRHYEQVHSLLKGMDRHLRSAPRTVPIISYDASYPVSPRRLPADEARAYRHTDTAHHTVIVEPNTAAHSHHVSKGQHKSRRKPNGYRTTVVQSPESLEAEMAQPRERRGSLYYSDQQRKGVRDYHVEVHEPEKERGKKEERRRSGYWV